MKDFAQYLIERKSGEYYVVELPSKDNDYMPSIEAGPFRTVDEAKRKGGYRDYGLNQDAVVAVLQGGDLYTVHYKTGEAVASLGNVLGGKAYRNLMKQFDLLPRG